MLLAGWGGAIARDHKPLELEPGEKPDFEVGGLAAAAFAETVKSRIIALLPRFSFSEVLVMSEVGHWPLLPASNGKPIL
jgi:hypothetical protein